MGVIAVPPDTYKTFPGRSGTDTILELAVIVDSHCELLPVFEASVLLASNVNFQLGIASKRNSCKIQRVEIVKA